jgi:hypothetical protein
VLFSVLDRVARAASHSEAAGQAGARVAQAGASFRTRLSAGPTVVRGGLAAAAADLPSPLGTPAATALPPEFCRAGAVSQPGVEVPYDAALDLAAELLEAADVLIEAGQPVEALALEGVSGRMLELVVDAGPCEGTPIGGRR